MNENQTPVRNALLALILTHETFDWLLEHDPQALRQALRAVSFPAPRSPEPLEATWEELRDWFNKVDLTPANSASYGVEMLAFTDPVVVRTVRIPASELEKLAGGPQEKVLEAIYKWGQNEYQPEEYPSVSPGDVIHYGGHAWMVADVGFIKLTQNELTDYRQIHRGARMCKRFDIQASRS